MFFVSKKRYNDLVCKNECLNKEIMALRREKIAQNYEVIEKCDRAVKLIAELQNERDEYKKLYLDEMQKRLELANQVRLRFG